MPVDQQKVEEALQELKKHSRVYLYFKNFEGYINPTDPNLDTFQMATHLVKSQGPYEGVSQELLQAGEGKAPKYMVMILWRPHHLDDRETFDAWPDFLRGLFNVIPDPLDNISTQFPERS